MSHPSVLLYLLLDLAIIIVAARTCGAIAKRMGQPAVIGEVIAGIILGPTLLGRLFPGLPAIIFPPEVPLKQIADLGLVFFTFLVGLELNTSLIRKQAGKSIAISLLGIALPFVLGTALGFQLAPLNNAGHFTSGTTHPPEPMVFAIFMGAAMCITAFPILARFLAETGLYKAPVGVTALCAAAVDDVIAWILLAAVIGIAKSGSLMAAWQGILLTILFAGILFTVVRRLLEMLAKRYDTTGTVTVDQVAIIVAGVLLSAMCTEMIGIHAIFGAFLFGVAMPKRSGMTHALTDRIEDFTSIILLPVFFCVVGLRTNLLTLDSVSLLGWTALILVVAIFGKLVGTGVAAWLTGSTKRDALVVGTLMNTRGLTELVILSIGLQLGVLSDQTMAMMVIMALTTTIMAAPIVNGLISRSEMIGTLVYSTAAHAHVHAHEAAAPQERPTSRVLVAVGNPENAPALLDAAIRLSGGKQPIELLLVKLIPSPRAPEFRSGLLDVDDRVSAVMTEMEPLIRQARKLGVSARPISFLTENVGMDLAWIAADQSCDLILLGWHRAHLQKNVVQSLVFRTFVTAPCDVAVLVDHTGGGIHPFKERPVLALLGGGVHDEKADAYASRLAESLSTGMRVESIAPSESSRESIVDATAGAAAAVMVVGEDWVLQKDFGNPTRKLAERAQCPVLVLRAANWAEKGRTVPGRKRTLRPQPDKYGA